MGKVILVIEDDPLILQFYKYIFEFEKLEAVISEDYIEIMNIIETKNVGLIIMDVNLRNTYINEERTDGIELSRIIKTDERYNNIPIILVSAYNLKVLDEESIANSLADDFILKPITDYNGFMTKVKSLIN